VPAERDTYAKEKPAAYTKRASADIQLPFESDERGLASSDLEKSSIKCEAVLSAIIPRRTFMTSQRAKAPEKTRTSVKVAGSMLLSLNAARQSSELLAKAIIASSVSMKIREVLIEEISNLEFDANALGIALFSLLQ
jgi:hypothetical protein